MSVHKIWITDPTKKKDGIRFLGEIEAQTFDEACKIFFKNNINYDHKKGTFFGYKLLSDPKK
ncbi:MAG: hypothetical protein PVJ67_03800 [Candidatus Pacearchaeota archaeon]|jgi:hypothetical protein